MHIKSDTNVDSGEAKPISYSVIPAILLKAKDRGTPIIKVAIMLWIIGNNELPQPLKNELMQNTKHTNIQSMLYDFRYNAAIVMTLVSFENKAASDVGFICIYP